ncbi:hypothetical protein V6N13_123727 [Hibiscus sabdariffa]
MRESVNTFPFIQAARFVIMIEDIDHVLRKCPHGFLVWCQLEQPSLSMEFMDVEIKQWVRENLKKGVKYGRDSRNWDIMFGGTCWFLWLYQNAFIFETPGAKT